jgi:putative flippase GtrA
MLSVSQYFRFLLVGAITGLFGIAARELIARMLVRDTVIYYCISVSFAYAIGIVVSFVLNRRFTFYGNLASRRASEFLTFVVISCVGLVSTSALAPAIRYGIRVDEAVGRFSADFAFAAAALLSSLFTYPFTALLVFRDRQLPGSKGPK